MKGLKRYLVENGYPLAVFLSEDGTRLTQHIQYDSRSKTVTGCVAPLDDRGLLEREYFNASNARVVIEKLESSPVANTAYVQVATPLAPNAASFVLFYMGTNNKFTFKDVLKRWRYTRRLLKAHGIYVIGIGSDGDPILLKAMITTMSFFKSTNSELGDLFVLQLEHAIICFQDIIHLLNKIVRKLRAADLEIGNMRASIDHLEYLVNHVGKDKHRLELSDLNPQDLQSFKPTEKIIEEDVINLLEAHVPESEGTVALLRYMRMIYLAFTGEKLNPLERISMCWYCFESLLR